jgi:cation:H+ antiporter
VLLHAGALLVGLAILIKAADSFVLGAGRLALVLRISPVVVGAVVIGFGTSSPELLVSGLAAWQGSLDIAVGNVVGSNIANLTLVASIAAIVSGLAVSSQTLRREAPIATAAVLVFALLVQGSFTRLDGVLLLVALALALGWLLRSAQRESDPEDPLTGEVAGRCGETGECNVRHEVLRTALGLLGTAGAAQLIVYGARGIAEETGIGEAFVGLTLVAIGTSLPEIVTAIQAARQGQSELVVGNLFGSNMFNSLAIGGVVALVGPGEVADASLTGLASVAMVASAVLAWFLMGTRQRLVRWEGVVLLAAYIALLPLVA